MSVTSQTPYKRFTAAPGATLFSTDFRVILATDLVIRKDGAVQTSGFTISGLGAPAGVDVTFGVPMAGGEIIELQRSVPLIRATDYQQTGDFLTPVVNTDFDRLWMALQDSQFLSNLAILLPVGDPLAPMTIPDVANRANRFLAFDALGQAIAAAGASGVPVSAFIATLLDDLNAASARTTLGALSAAMNTARLLGRLSGGAGPVEELTAQQVGNFAMAVSPMQPLAASVASNALTITLNPTIIEFRDPVAASGAVLRRQVTAPITLTISNGSTLGTASGVNERLAVLALDNNGTVELAVVNLSGGVNLDESSIISTTAEGGAGGADSASVIYSTATRIGLAYRILGFIEGAQAAAGVWSAPPGRIYCPANPLAVWLSGYGTRSVVHLHTTNGYGSTATQIRRWLTTVRNIGSDITYADSASDGGSFTINRAGTYSITYVDNFNTAGPLGVSLNSNELTTQVGGIAAGTRLAEVSTPSANTRGCASVTLPLLPGDVIRAHANGAPAGAAGNSLFIISRVN